MNDPPPDITWPDQVAPPGWKASSTRKIKPQTSNLMELRTLSRSGHFLSMGDTLQLKGAGSATSLHSSAPALLQALRTRCPGTRPRT